MSEVKLSLSFGGLGTILFVVFLILKLIGIITWSWVWITAPLWISFGFFVVAILCCVLPIVLITAFANS